PVLTRLLAVGAVPGGGEADLSAAALPLGSAVRAPGRVLDPVRTIRREDDRRELHHGRGRVRVWLGRVPEARGGRAGRPHRRPVPALARGPHAAHWARGD